VNWTDCECAGRDFRDEDLSRLQIERVLFTECDFRVLEGADLRGVDLSGCVAAIN
jgi:uncharacterized protein YjbI with pentapeptide repeats